MKSRLLGPVIAALLCSLMVVPAADSALVARMDLGDLADNAHRIFRATVLDVEQSSVSVGGGELPAVVVTLKVDDVLKGDFAEGKAGQVVEIKILGSIKDSPVTVGDYQRVNALPDLPQLQLGDDYLLFTTEPSSIGLSTTVGLGQGSFRIYLDDQNEVASNELDNAGLFDGPVSYSALTAAINDELGN